MNNSLDRIQLRGLCAQGILGVNQWERENTQEIVAQVTLFVDTRQAACTDNLIDTVDYDVLGQAVTQHLTNSKCLLVERLCQELANLCFAHHDAIEAVNIEVAKPAALDYAESVSVSIYRTRNS